MTLLCLGAAAVTALALWHPSGWVPACPTRRLLGFYCPGCGSLRATHHALNGRLAAAFSHNPLLLILGFPLALWYWSERASIVASGLRFHPLFRSRAVAWAALAVVIGFTVLRNLPSGVFDILRPPVSEGPLEPEPLTPA